MGLTRTLTPGSFVARDQRDVQLRIVVRALPDQPFARDADVDEHLRDFRHQGNRSLGLLRGIVRVLQRRPRGKLERDRELAPVGDRDELGADEPERDEHEREHEGGDGPGLDDPGMPERPSEGLLVECGEPPEESFIRVEPERCSSLVKREARSGVTVNETKRLMRVEKTTTSANSRMMFPTSPVTRLRGRNTTTSTSVIDSAAKPISFRPISAAARWSSPASRWR